MGLAKVLVVDDEVDVRMLMEIVLSDADYDVESVESAETILEDVARVEPDIIVLDLTMPNVDGLTALRMLREQPATGSLPILVASAQAQKSTMLQARELGANDFLVKPWSDGELEWRVAECLKQAGAQSN